MVIGHWKKKKKKNQVRMSFFNANDSLNYKKIEILDPQVKVVFYLTRLHWPNT